MNLARILFSAYHRPEAFPPFPLSLLMPRIVDPWIVNAVTQRCTAVVGCRLPVTGYRFLTVGDIWTLLLRRLYHLSVVEGWGIPGWLPLSHKASICLALLFLHHTCVWWGRTGMMSLSRISTLITPKSGNLRR